MNFIKNNIKAVITFLIGMFLASTITAYAIINANTVDYSGNKKVSDALNELYVRSISDKIYSQTEYNNYGTSEYNRGYSAGQNSFSSGTEYKVGEFTSTEKGRYEINCGFCPRHVSVLFYNLDNGEINSMYFYDNLLNSQRTYRNKDGELTDYAFATENSEITENRIYKITSTGFGFQFSKNGNRKIRYTAIK